MALSKTFLSIFLIAIILSWAALVGSMHFGEAQGGTTGDWPMFNHDLAHTGYSTSTVPMTNQTLWTFTTGGAVESSPAVVNGIVYVGSDDGCVYALNAANGALIWNYSTGGPVQSSPAVVDGVVYVGGFHSHAIFALNAYTGALIWSSPTDSVYPDEISSTAVANGLVYVDIDNNGVGGELDALNASTGNLVWKYAPGNAYMPSSPTIFGGMVYIGTSQEVVALDAATGEPSWSYFVVSNGPTSYGGSVIYFGYSSLSISDGLVYIGTTN